jgi:NADH-quinone oxidoreductase subunit N
MFSIIVGSISAIYQKRLKRLFAYSTIAHTGFILLAFLCNSLDGSKSLIFYILIYSCLTIITFSVLINIAIKTPIQPKYLINLATVGSKNYIFASTFALIILSIAGIPPLAGFFSKFFILFSVISSEYYFIAMTIVIFSSIACFYYIRLVKILFFVKNSKNSLWFTNKSQQNNEIIIGSFLFFIIFYYFFPNFVIDFSVVVSLLMF